MDLAFDKHPYRFTACEYLTFERATLDRHEYLDGVIYAMAGESRNHGRICSNLAALLHAALRGTPCEVLSKDTKVRSGPQRAETRQGLYSYPDVVVVCGGSPPEGGRERHRHPTRGDRSPVAFDCGL